MSLATPSLPNWRRPALWLPKRRRVMSPLAMSNIFRWRGADRSGNSCKTCGCATPTGTCLSCCTGNGGPTAWDVDLTGIAVSGGTCTTAQCSAIASVLTLSHDTDCSWLYDLPICPEVLNPSLSQGYRFQLGATVQSGVCQWAFIVLARVYPTGAGGGTVAEYILNGSQDCSKAMTLPLITAPGGGVCAVTWPFSVTATPA